MTNSRQSRTDPGPIQRRAGAAQGALLLAGSCLSVLAAVLLTPIIPQLQEEFGDSPLVLLIISAPALMIAVFAPFAGQIVDRIGRKPLLLGAMILYSVVGVAPVFLDSLPSILVTRLLVGVCEAAIMTCCTTLIADYYSGDRRNRYFGLQTVCTTIAATIFLVLGGLLGGSGWRTPFWVYAISIVIVIPMFFVLWEPRRSTADIARSRAAAKVPVPWRRLALPLIVALFGGFVFFVLLAESPLIYVGVGITDPQQIGLLSAVASLATAIASISFARLAKHGWRAKRLLPVSFGLIAVGFIIIAFAAGASALAGVVIGAVIASLGSGLLLPTMVVWAIGGLGFEERGRSTGLWQAAFFFGQFVTPILIGIIQQGIGGDPLDSLPLTIGLVGGVCVVVAILLAVVVKRPAPTAAASDVTEEAAEAVL